MRPLLAGLAVAACVACIAVVGSARETDGEAAASAPSVTLVVTGVDGAGRPRSARLACGAATVAATSFLRPRGAAACAAARRLAGFLDTPPPRGRICTQIFGGRDTARVRGRIGARFVDRRFARHNGCEIADWTAAQTLLYRPLGVVGL